MSTIHCFICITISNNIYRKVKSGHVNQASARTRKCFWPFIFQFCAMLAILVRATLEFLTKMHYRCLKKEKKGNHINCATEHQLMPKPNCCYNISKPIKRFAIFSQLSEFIFFYHGKIWNSKKTFLCIFCEKFLGVQIIWFKIFKTIQVHATKMEGFHIVLVFFLPTLLCIFFPSKIPPAMFIS